MPESSTRYNPYLTLNNTTGDQSMSMEACREQVVMEETDERKDRDVRVIDLVVDRWHCGGRQEGTSRVGNSWLFQHGMGRGMCREASSQAYDTLTAPSPAGRQASSSFTSVRSRR
jgi:hypothetical protein